MQSTMRTLHASNSGCGKCTLSIKEPNPLMSNGGRIQSNDIDIIWPLAEHAMAFFSVRTVAQQSSTHTHYKQLHEVVVQCDRPHSSATRLYVTYLHPAMDKAPQKCATLEGLLLRTSCVNMDAHVSMPRGGHFWETRDQCVTSDDWDF